MRKVFGSDRRLNEVLLLGMVYKISRVNCKLRDPQQIVSESQWLVHFLRVVLRKQLSEVEKLTINAQSYSEAI